MRNTIGLLLLCILGTCGFHTRCFAQNAEGKMDDNGRIVLVAYIPNQIENFPEIAKSALSNKLNQIVTQSGMGGSSRSNSPFIITANITVQTKDITPTAPPMTAITLEVTFYIGNGVDGTKYASTSVSAKGVGTNETKAYMEAIKGINTSNTSIQNFVSDGKRKILEYYNTKCDFIIKNAQNLASQNEYEQAIYTLTSVPDVCKECYEKSLAATGPIYRQYVDRQCKLRLGEARTHWLSSQNAAGAAYAADILSTIDPDASCYKDAMALSKEIGARIKELDKRDWDFKMKVHNDQVS